MPELDAIRGIAILAVLIYHAFYWTQDLSRYPGWQRYFLTALSPGQFGVNLFFVLSGFLITGILLESRSRPDFYGRFYFRRALRILPAYYFTIILLILFGLTSRGFLLMSLAYCSNLSGLFGIALSYPVLWSLAVEEHFYLLWPTAVKRLRPHRLVWLLVAILVLSPLSRCLYHLAAIHSVAVGATFCYYTWNNADGLALGAIVALLLRRPDWKRSELGWLSVTFFVLSFLIAALGYPQILTRRSTIGESLQGVPWNLASAGVLGVFLLLGTSSWRRVATPRVLTFFGNLSYGLYLYHLMFLMGYAWLAGRIHVDSWNLTPWKQLWLRAMVANGAAVIFSYLSRRYLEEPFLRWKNARPTFSRRESAAPRSASSAGGSLE